MNYKQNISSNFPHQRDWQLPWKQIIMGNLALIHKSEALFIYNMLYIYVYSVFTTLNALWLSSENTETMLIKIICPIIYKCICLTIPELTEISTSFFLNQQALKRIGKASVAQSRTFPENGVSTIAADALAPSITRSSATTILTPQDKLSLS